MKQQPDNFFGDKLKGHQMPVPAGSWERIEKNLLKKNNKALWLRVAAALTILALAFTYIVIRQGSDKVSGNIIAEAGKDESLSGKGDPRPKENGSANDSVKRDATPRPVQVRPSTRKKSAPAKQTKTKKAPVPAEPQNAFRSADNQSIALAAEEAQETSIDKGQDSIAPADVVNTLAAADEASPVKKSSVKIVYRAEDVNEKYLDKNAIAQATPDDKKSSTLRKLFDKAADLKHNQDPFGELRQKKNEILALNFKNEKQRNQNR